MGADNAILEREAWSKADGGAVRSYERRLSVVMYVRLCRKAICINIDFDWDDLGTLLTMRQ